MNSFTQQKLTFTPVNVLADLLQQRLIYDPHDVAYVDFDQTDEKWRYYSWQELGSRAARIQSALISEGVVKGERVGLMLNNSWQWAAFDIAAQGLGLVTVPIYTNDRPENIAYILRDANVRVLLIGGDEQWRRVRTIEEQATDLLRVVSVEPCCEEGDYETPITLNSWCVEVQEQFLALRMEPDTLATLVYTSGTTGRPKGVMLSHRNILWNIEAALKQVDVFADDLFLSFLPLSHTLERTVGHYLPMAVGVSVAHARSIKTLADDLLTLQPSVMIAVPRVFERLHGAINKKLQQGSAINRWLFKLTVDLGRQRFEYQQGRSSLTPRQWIYPLLNGLVGSKIRAKLGGRLRVAVSGGAALSSGVSRDLIALGVPILQGYGLTETSPIISANQLEDNIPESVGAPLPGVEIKVGEHWELLTRSPSVMLGYWKNPESTHQVIDSDGWCHTGDVVSIEGGKIYIRGRIKEIIVLSTGEKIAPADIENCLTEDEAIDQSLVVGEGRPFLGVLVVPSKLGQSMLDSASLLKRIAKRMARFPGYAKIHRLALISTPWTIDNGMMTPTLKLRRGEIMRHYSKEIDGLYSGHF